MVAARLPDRVPGRLGYDAAGVARPRTAGAEGTALGESHERGCLAGNLPQLLADPDYKKVYATESLVPDFISHDAYVKFVNDFGASSESFLKETGAAK